MNKKILLLFQHVMTIQPSFAVIAKKILKQIDFKTLKVELGTFIDNNLQMRMTDMLYSVKMRGAKAYIYILVEHQSTADILMPFRLLEYKVRIIRHYLDTGGDPKKLPIVVPIVLYNGLVKYPYSCDLFDLFDDPLNIAKEVWVDPFNLYRLENSYGHSENDYFQALSQC